ncbi:hypothetical protein [Sphingomonas sp. C3-2]|uniref:hypothetical protein n=1 Tax=Sphingomonas sp. C3-2 TaxID=3062169 RepID=UPI00294B19A3|nr:hypothetical protein [Sphingomonas sp. C3-2]WOK35931.1 hypothetical protein QYC26_13095 [Sphingomonas sp. C3-2]
MTQAKWLAAGAALILLPAAPGLAQATVADPVASAAIQPMAPADMPQTQLENHDAEGLFGAGVAVLDAGILGKVAGREDVWINDQVINVQNTSTVSGNTITGDFQTGTIGIDGSAFDNFNGLALFNLNTGNNVAINSSMSVNVSFQK